MGDRGLTGLAVAAVTVATLLGPSAAAVAAERTPTSFEVTNVQDGGTYTLSGYRVDGPCEATTAVLLLHGLSYTGEAWDFAPPTYSFARTIADAGYTVVAVDRLGYGASVLGDGYQVSTYAHAEMAHDIVLALREEFAHVVLGGHSAGAEATEQSAATYGDVDAIVPMGYHHFPSEQIVEDFFTGDIPRALQDDYEYFLGTPEHREEMFFTDDADPAIVAADTEAAVLTPSGEILTIGSQPSRAMLGAIDVPVFLQLATDDALFPGDFTDAEAALFLGAPSVTLDVVEGAGHTYLLHRSGPAAGERLRDWLVALPEAPPCEAAAAADDEVPVPDDPPPAPAPAPAGPALPATGAGLALAGVLSLALSARRRRG